MKYKPTVLPLTQVVAKMGNDGWTFLAGVAEVALQLKLAAEGVPPTYGCGKPGCTGTFVLISKTERPIVCPKCGVEIDWTGIATKKVKRCPSCGRVGNDWDSFCKFHVPAIALSEKDEPIRT